MSLHRELPSLDISERERYSRQTLIPQFGEKQQQLLKQARVLSIGAGGLGSPAMAYLASSGVGHIGIIDSDLVERSNLARQLLHTEESIGVRKIDSAMKSLRSINPHCDITPIFDTFNAANALELCKDYDVILDGSDNFTTRYIANDATVISNTPYVWGAIFQSVGHVSTFHHTDPRLRASLRDIFPDMPRENDVPNCAQAGVFTPLCGIIGSIMAAETMKVITGYGQPLNYQMLSMDVSTMRCTTVHFKRDPDQKRYTDLHHFDDATKMQEKIDHFTNFVEPQDISPDNLSKTVIDVREKEERENGYIPQSLHLPLTSLTEKSLSAVIPDKHAPIVFYCASGRRSLRAAVEAQQWDYTEVSSLTGGYHKWETVHGHMTN